uniref:ATP synthase complex subunit 8 n=1 Tax=Atrocalopteryx atrata TaxID=193161 RepID=A0A0F7DHC5_9ODON|nr:ATP synthase F0 subunit 8 [Atrocalopteryx atrata]AKH04384.1 ATP synthase F0 subunit 8 [Atrocalopteryx atrata]
MPQMAPMSWLTLFTLFSMNMVIMAMINYYLYTPTMETKSMSVKLTQKMSWKW